MYHQTKVFFRKLFERLFIRYPERLINGNIEYTNYTEGHNELTTQLPKPSRKIPGLFSFLSVMLHVM